MHISIILTEHRNPKGAFPLQLCTTETKDLALIKAHYHNTTTFVLNSSYLLPHGCCVKCLSLVNKYQATTECDCM